MTLGETIQYYRRRAGLSQEALAELVGVSRQAVSKWELDEATPEVSKLVALARAFGITTDQLLSGEPQSEPTPPPQASATANHADSLSALPGFLGRMVRRHGWLAGVYLALQGLGVALVGFLARFAFGQMFRVAINDFNGFGWAAAAVDSAGNPVDLPPGVMAELFGQTGGGLFDGFGSGQVTVLSDMGQILVTIATVVLIVGLLTAIAGAVLAAYLYRKGRES